MKSLAALAILTSTALAGPVTLIHDGLVWRAGSQFEIRFSEPMVMPDAVGKQAEAPIVVQPAVAGKWTWLSTQSGVFAPTEPPALGAKYRLTLRGNLKDAGGKAVKGPFSETLETPAFRVKGWVAPRYLNVDNAPTRPFLSVLFSAPVDAKTIAERIWFLGPGMIKVPAKVTQAQPKLGGDHAFPEYRSDDRSPLAWADAFRVAHETAADGNALAEALRTAQKNHVFVEPVNELTPGENWTMIVAQGLPAAAGGYKLALPYEVKVGRVRPFTVERVATENLINSGKLLTLDFSKPFGKSVTRENIAQWVKVEPEPPGLKVEMASSVWSDAAVAVKGNFELGRDYTVSVAAGIESAEGQKMEAWSKAVSFAPVKSRLYFQEYSTHQQRTGNREFRVLGVNTSHFRITARLVPREQTAAALAAYRAYDNYEGKLDDEYHTRVEDAAIPGEVVWSQDFRPTQKVDEKFIIPLKWDEILGVGRTGTVFLTAEQPDKTAPNVPRVGTQALVQVTNLGVIWKGGAGGFAQVFSLQTGKPVAGAKVALLDEKGASLASATSAADGTARLPKAEKSEWLAVTFGDDQQLVPFGDERRELEFGRFRINMWGDEEDIYDFGGEEGGTLRGTMFSDRPVYKPGETVHLKAVVRDYTPDRPHIPAGRKGTLRVFAPDGREVKSEKFTLSAMGSFSGEAVLPKTAVGGFRAQIIFDSEKPGAPDEDEDSEWAGIRHYFRVEEYEPNAFEVKLSAPKSLLLGAPLNVALDAKYYMGKPLAKAQVAWSLRSEDERFTPAGFEDFWFTEALNDWRLREKFAGKSDYSEQGKLALPDGGSATITAQVPLNTTMPQPRFVRLTAEVTDLNQQTIAERQIFTMHSSEFYLGIHKMPEVVREGEALPVKVVAVRNDGQPMKDAVETTVKLTRVEWQTNRVQDADEAENFRSEPMLQFVGQTVIRTQPLVQKAGDWVLADGAKTDKTLTVDKPGLYLLSAVATDASGRNVITTASIYVHGKDTLTWNYRNKSQVELVPDKKEYRPGEEAVILVKTPISGSALVTIEREHVRRHFVTTLEGNAPTIRVPVEELDAPNVFVSVMIVRGAQDSPRKYKTPEFRAGYTQLVIARPDAKLYVNLRPEKPDVRPGDEVTVICEVRDNDGKPVRNAEVTLWASDEGVLSLMAFKTPDILSYFSQMLRLDVTTGITLSHMLSDDPEGALFENKGYLVGAAKGSLKGGEADVRRNFLGTAYWNGALKTGADGNVTTKFKAPDGLTRYRIMAVAQTLRDQFGSGESSFEVNKPVMIEPSTPRFANVGDSMTVRAVLHNTTPHDGDANVSVLFDERANAANSTRTVKLPANGSLAVDFVVEFKEPGEAKWIWTVDFAGAGGGKFRDSVESKLKVTWPTPLLGDIVTGRTQGDAELIGKADPALLEGAGTVRVRFSNSRIFELSEGVDELLHYPYGCIEQTTSGMLPWISLREFRPMLPGMKRTEQQITDTVDRAIARIISMQNGDGGLGYWPGARSEQWGSAYGGMGLVMAQRAGFSVPPDAVKRLGDYLGKSLRGASETSDKWQLSERVFACYSLALMDRPEVAYHELLNKKRDILTQESRAILALAILESKGSAKTADSLLRMTDKAVEADWWFGSTARAQAIRLLAWTKIAGKSPAADEIADALLALRSRGHWGTTQSNAWALMGFAEYVRKTEANRKEIKGALAYGPNSTPVELPAKGGFFEKEMPLLGKEPMKLTNPTKGMLFTQVAVSSRPRTLVTQRQDRGYSIERTYQRINDDGSLAPLGQLTVGHRVLVSIDVIVPRASRYVVVDDPLPATFEAINPEFATAAAQGDNLARQWWSHREMRADRVIYFTNSWSSGKYQMRYLARVRAAGSATAPPTKVEEMYQPASFGLGDSALIKAGSL
jgi:alpha-2-macroglobulin